MNAIGFSDGDCTSWCQLWMGGFGGFGGLAKAAGVIRVSCGHSLAAFHGSAFCMGLLGLVGQSALTYGTIWCASVGICLFFCLLVGRRLTFGINS
jgi:hypothetical protein